jgi:hypothetical protein
MNFENFFKTKYYKEELLENKEKWIDSDVMLITGKEARIVKREDYDKLFQYKNKLEEHIELPKKKISIEQKKSLPRRVDPEKKPYINLNIDKLTEEVNKYKVMIDEIKVRNSDEAKRKKLIEVKRLTDKWLKLSQEAVYTILEMFPQNEAYEGNTIKKTLAYFKIDKEDLDYDSENECFND